MTKEHEELIDRLWTNMAAYDELPRVTEAIEEMVNAGFTGSQVVFHARTFIAHYRDACMDWARAHQKKLIIEAINEVK